MTPRAQRICVAQIGAPHGVRGEVKLWPFTQDPVAVRDYGPLETEDGATRFEIETLRAANDHLVVRLKGVNDRDAAERLTNTKLFVARERLPETEADDEYYHADLIGLAVVDSDGNTLGRVAAIHNFGAGDLVEVKPEQGNTTVLLPFTEAAVPAVDIAGKQIVVDAAAFTAAATPGEPEAEER
ncbi:MAG: ribosome maturation factor RimM [Xanthobacteraceae bacterium]|nr:ribosome maturation factor RimM [Xanthobacteraceae bacterium]